MIDGDSLDRYLEAAADLAAKRAAEQAAREKDRPVKLARFPSKGGPE